MGQAVQAFREPGFGRVFLFFRGAVTAPSEAIGKIFGEAGIDRPPPLA
jgi:hypothetical protein